MPKKQKQPWQSHPRPPSPLDPVQLRHIFDLADAFRRTGFLIEGKIAREWTTKEVVGSNAQMIMARVTNHAFALELYLKCLIAIETNAKPPRGHNHKDLFNALTKRSQQRAESYYNEHMRCDPGTPGWIAEYRQQGMDPNDFLNLRVALSKAVGAFEMYRYAYERNLTSYMLGPLEPVVRQIILEQKPEWVASAQPTPTCETLTPPTSPIR